MNHIKCIQIQYRGSIVLYVFIYTSNVAAVIVSLLRYTNTKSYAGEGKVRIVEAIILSVVK